MNTPLIWNFDDVDSNLLAVEYNKKTIGYFRMDKEEFVMITDSMDSTPLPINILKAIVHGYDDALKEARKLVEI